MFALFALAFLVGGCRNVYQSGFVQIPRQSIAGETEIGGEWREFAAPAPLVPYGSSQSVVLGFTEYDRQNFSDGRTGETLNLADGRKTRIEAFVYDEKGEVYELQITGIGGAGGGVWLSRKFVKKDGGSASEMTAPDFPADRNYTKLKIRSEIPLKCSRIEWVGTNSK